MYSSETQKLGKLKILIVEDIPFNQLLTETTLHDFGFETDIAENGRVAIELLEQNHYDVILMDLMMPEMDGFEATRFIRTEMLPPKSTTPIIALTADLSVGEMDKCIKVGIDKYISKPFNPTELLNKISLLVNKMRTTAEVKICNLDYLKSLSPNNPKFLRELIQLVLTQTPQYISEMNQCLAAYNWDGFHSNAHKLRPSVDFLGMPIGISHAAKLMDEYAANRQYLHLIPDLFLKVDHAFQQAYRELQIELKNLTPLAIGA